jgi:hypothetical protein
MLFILDLHRGGVSKAWRWTEGGYSWSKLILEKQESKKEQNHMMIKAFIC